MAGQWAASVGSDFLQYGAGTLGPEKAHAPVVEDVKVKSAPLLGPKPGLKAGPKLGSLVWAILRLQ